MVVTVEQIRPEGLELDEPIGPALLEEALRDPRDTGFRVREGGRLHISLQRVSGGVLLRGKLDVKAVGSCRRCLVDVPIELPVSFTLNLVAAQRQVEDDEDGEDGGAGGGAESEGSFGLDDADQEAFDGRKIDLDPIIREQVLLALPMNVVCQESCKGLCATCGQNLNEKACGCRPEVVDPRLAVLKDIKLN